MSGPGRKELPRAKLCQSAGQSPSSSPQAGPHRDPLKAQQGPLIEHTAFMTGYETKDKPLRPPVPKQRDSMARLNACPCGERAQHDPLVTPRPLRHTWLNTHLPPAQCTLLCTQEPWGWHRSPRPLPASEGRTPAPRGGRRCVHSPARALSQRPALCHFHLSRLPPTPKDISYHGNNYVVRRGGAS